MKKREEKRLKNLAELRRLLDARDASLPTIWIQELTPYHFRLSCNGLTVDYWPSRDRVWVLWSRRSRIMRPARLIELLASEKPNEAAA